MKKILILFSIILLLSIGSLGKAQTYWSGNTVGSSGTAFGYQNTVNGLRALGSGYANTSSQVASIRIVLMNSLFFYNHKSKYIIYHFNHIQHI